MKRKTGGQHNALTILWSETENSDSFRHYRSAGNLQANINTRL